MKPQLITDLCRHFGQNRFRRAARSETWNIIFNDSGLYHLTPVDRPPNSPRKATPTMPLRKLIDMGIFKPESSFSDIDKATLALSLGRCLLHLLHSGWTQDEWTNDTINFLYAKDKSQERIFDVHHPYITCALSRSPLLSEDGSGPTIPKTRTTLPAAEWHRALWSFARLLIEIENGHLSQIDIYDDPMTIRNQIWGELRKLDIGGRVGEITIYMQAIHGCVNFAKSLLQHQNRASGILKKHTTRIQGFKNISYSSDDVRRIFYSEVIQYLETHYEILSKNTESTTRCDITLPAILTERLGPISEEPATDPKPVYKCSFYSQPVSPGDLLTLVHPMSVLPQR
jgi:hypothetical protein